MPVKKLWQPGRRQGSTVSSDFAVIEDELRDLRSVRGIVEDVMAQLDGHGLQSEPLPAQHCGQASMIVKHLHLQPSNLSRLRSLLEIMGL